MALIGIIRGFGEGYAATGYIIKIIKALNRRFRSKLRYIEIPLGDYVKFGSELKSDAIDAMLQCDCIYSGDISSSANPLNYAADHIALALSNDIEIMAISGFGEHFGVNVQMASYFDGGAKLRESSRTTDGCCETRVCSTYNAKNIVKHISRICENRRRRLVFVKDGDNEYCADLFYSKFEDFTLPLSNFKLFKFSTSDLFSEILYDPKQFDIVFASKALSDAAMGLYKAIMGNCFASYRKYSKHKSLYTVKSHLTNSPSGEFVPSMPSYIIALSDLLLEEFNMQKEASAIRHALEETAVAGFTGDNCDEFTAAFITSLNKPVPSKYPKQSANKRYIK